MLVLFHFGITILTKLFYISVLHKLSNLHEAILLCSILGQMGHPVPGHKSKNYRFPKVFDHALLEGGNFYLYWPLIIQLTRARKFFFVAALTFQMTGLNSSGSVESEFH